MLKRPFGCVQVRVQVRVRASMDILSECHVQHEFSGAMAVSVFFLIVFVVLLVGDGVLTWYALTRTLTRNERLEREKRDALAKLDEEIVSRTAELRSMDRKLHDLVVGKTVPEGVIATGLRWAPIGKEAL